MRTKFLSAADLASRLGVSRATIWRWKREGHIPPPVYLGARCTRWRVEDIVTYEKRLTSHATTG